MNRTSKGIILGEIILAGLFYVICENQLLKPDYQPPPYSTRSAVEPLTRQIDVSSIAVSPAALRLTSFAGIQVTISSNGGLVRII
jgi:hypothetical protein